MELLVHSNGRVSCVYSEALDLTALGNLDIQRASHVEPDETGHWTADLLPVAGPKLGPFAQRSQALAAEQAYLAVLAHPADLISRSSQRGTHAADPSFLFPCSMLRVRH